MTKKKETNESSRKISFEESIKNLEEIVRKLESEAPTLDNSIKLFEDGVIYTNICNKYLKDAKMKVELLTKNDSEFEIEDF